MLKKQVKYLEKNKAGNIITFEADEEMRAAGYSEADIEGDGFFQQDGTIVINVARASEAGAISVASHELLHNILKSEFKADPAREKKVINRIKKYFKTKGAFKCIR